LWQIRVNPKVKRAFETLLGTHDLISSMDGGNLFLPWHTEGLAHAKTDAGWFHVDQGNLRRGFHCVQGIVTLMDCHEATGGFCLIPESPMDHGALMELAQVEKDFVMVPPAFPTLRKRQVLPRYSAGDMILWYVIMVKCVR
jgi:hypothetical protein